MNETTANGQTVVLQVPALHCGGCIASAAHVLEGFPGVLSVRGDMAVKELTVEYVQESVTPTALAAQLAEVGFPVTATRPL